MRFDMDGDFGITLPDPGCFSIVDNGKEIWRGDAQQFAALMDGMTWEHIGINPEKPTHRRLVSRLYPIKENPDDKGTLS